jgi:hypothetical protein
MVRTRTSNHTSRVAIFVLAKLGSFVELVCPLEEIVNLDGSLQRLGRHEGFLGVYRSLDRVGIGFAKRCLTIGGEGGSRAREERERKSGKSHGERLDGERRVWRLGRYIKGGLMCRMSVVREEVPGSHHRILSAMTSEVTKHVTPCDEICVCSPSSPVIYLQKERKQSKTPCHSFLL